jgi:ketosteroid isomerase-like protein
MHGVDDAEGVGELVVEDAHGVDDEVLVGDGMADVDKSVRQAFEMAAKIADGEITLLQTMEVL